ncbi:PilZ domain-containing protein [Litoreibacter roseus]|uniref:PilZ domain-containing protein n=1 Tax=Litoreibacter roseus TaxID=2601869 RepID=A0A6N6JBP3_9RHOB|nr:PilZ domain-containing protein [Litoreibacter roseus]GFE63484.1 hypothetical protein KIN_05580 [Litoreibacter roseus]
MKYRPHRYVTDIDLNCIAGDTHVLVQAINISPYGMRLKCDLGLMIGMPITVEILGRQTAARVAWTRPDSIGIVFKQALSIADLKNFRRMKGPGGHRRPALRRVHEFAGG